MKRKYFDVVGGKIKRGGGGGGGGEISRGVGQGHVLRSRNLRCWKQRTQMPHRVVRSLIHSSWCHVIDCSVRPYSISPRTCRLRCFITFTQTIWNSAAYLVVWGWASIRQPSACLWVEVRISYIFRKYKCIYYLLQLDFVRRGIFHDI